MERDRSLSGQWRLDSTMRIFRGGKNPPSKLRYRIVSFLLNLESERKRQKEQRD